MKTPNRRQIGLGLFLGSIALCAILWGCGFSVVTIQRGGTPGAGWEAIHINFGAPVLLVTGILGVVLLLWPSSPRSQEGQVSQ